jgi:hypothetical protein
VTADDFLTAFPWDAVSVTGLCVGITWLIVTGRLVPRATVDRLLDDRDHRNEFLERHIDAQQAVKSELAHQNTELLSTAKLATALLKAVAPRETHVVQVEE